MKRKLYIYTYMCMYIYIDTYELDNSLNMVDFYIFSAKNHGINAAFLSNMPRFPHLWAFVEGRPSRDPISLQKLHDMMKVPDVSTGCTWVIGMSSV